MYDWLDGLTYTDDINQTDTCIATTKANESPANPYWANIAEDDDFSKSVNYPTSWYSGWWDLFLVSSCRWNGLTTVQGDNAASQDFLVTCSHCNDTQPYFPGHTDRAGSSSSHSKPRHSPVALISSMVIPAMAVLVVLDCRLVGTGQLDAFRPQGTTCPHCRYVQVSLSNCLDAIDGQTFSKSILLICSGYWWCNTLVLVYNRVGLDRLTSTTLVRLTV